MNKLQDEENPLEKIKSINKNNNDNKANFYNKNKKDLHNKIKRPVANNRYKKNLQKSNPVQNLTNKEGDDIPNNDINIKESSAVEKNKNNKNIIKDVHKPNLEHKQNSSKKPKSNFKNSDKIVSSSSKTNQAKDDTKPIKKTKIKKQIIKTVKTKRKGPAKKGWWNKEE